MLKTEIRKCLKCGKIFAYFSVPICEECSKIEEEIFLKVSNYIRNNPNNDIKRIEQDTEVSANKILKYIKDGRLMMSLGMGNAIFCERCGDSITTGRFCEKCIVNLRVGFQLEKEEPKLQGKMHGTFRKK